QAAPEAILCGATTAHLVQAVVRVEALEPMPGAGASASGVYTIRGRRTPPRPLSYHEARVLTPFVGRQRELATLHALLAQARAGRGKVVGVVGDPGMGKSRLVYEFQHSLQGQPVTYLPAAVSPMPLPPPMGPCCPCCGTTVAWQRETPRWPAPRRSTQVL